MDGSEQLFSLEHINRSWILVDFENYFSSIGGQFLDMRPLSGRNGVDKIEEVALKSRWSS